MDNRERERIAEELREAITEVCLPEWHRNWDIEVCRCEACLARANKKTELILGFIKKAGYTRQPEIRRLKMEDRERVAEELYEFSGRYGSHRGTLWKIAGDKTKEDYLREADFLLGEILPHLGYTRQPEPPADKVEAVAKSLYFKAGGDGWENLIALNITWT